MDEKGRFSREIISNKNLSSFSESSINNTLRKLTEDQMLSRIKRKDNKECGTYQIKFFYTISKQGKTLIPLDQI